MNYHDPAANGKPTTTGLNRKLTDTVRRADSIGVPKTRWQTITNALPQQGRTPEMIEDAIAKIEALIATPSADQDDPLHTLTGELEKKETSVPSTLPEAAIYYGEQLGWKIFPCVSNDKGKLLPEKERKKPATPNGFKDATNDPEKIREWWGENPNYNIGVCPEHQGECVVEVDSYKPDCGVAELNLPPTRRSRSPRDGTHHYFKGSLPPTAGQLATHVDTRGRNSYVLVPPSVVMDKPYIWEDVREPVELPRNIADQLNKPKVQVRPSDDTSRDTDKKITEAKRRVRSYINKNDVAIAGRGGNSRTYKLGAELIRDLGLTVPTALEVIAPWNAACVPPWSTEELTEILEHSDRYGQNAYGADVVKTAQETFGVYKPKADETVADVSSDPAHDKEVLRWMKRMGGSRPIDDVDLPDAEWWDAAKTIQRDPDGYVVLYQGGKGVMKTFLTVAKLVALVRDRGARVGYIAGEGARGVRTTRIQAIAAHYGVSLENLSKNWVTYRSAPDLFNGAARQALKSLIKRDFPTGIDFIVVDTLGQASPGQDLNSPAFGSALTEATKDLREEFKCCVIVVHHLGKDPRRGALGSVMIVSDPGTVAEFRKVKGRSDMREEYIHHVREGEADRSIGYKIVTASSLHGTPSPVPVPVSELELKTAKLKAKREKNKTQDRLRMEAEIMRDILIERSCTTNLNGLPSLGIAQNLWEHQAKLAGKLKEHLTPEENAQREGEIKAIADRIGKAAKRHMTECRGAYYETLRLWGIQGDPLVRAERND